MAICGRRHQADAAARRSTAAATSDGENEAARPVGQKTGRQRPEDLADAEGGRHQRQHPAGRLGGQATPGLEAEGGQGDEGAAEQQGRRAADLPRRRGRRWQPRPTASSRQPAANAPATPRRGTASLHRATEGMPARPASSHTAGSKSRPPPPFAHDGDQEGRGDDVAETEETVGKDDAGERRAARQPAFARPAAATTEPCGASTQHGGEAGERQATSPQPAGLPGRAVEDEEPGHHRRSRNAEADAAEMHGLKASAAGGGQPGRRRWWWRRPARRRWRRPRAKRMTRKAASEPVVAMAAASSALARRAASISRLSRPCRPAAGGGQRPDQVAEIVGGGDRGRPPTR